MKNHALIVDLIRSSGEKMSSISRRSGISGRQISRWLKGETTVLHPSSVEAVVRALGKQVQWLNSDRTECVLKEHTQLEVKEGTSVLDHLLDRLTDLKLENRELKKKLLMTREAASLEFTSLLTQMTEEYVEEIKKTKDLTKKVHEISSRLETTYKFIKDILKTIPLAAAVGRNVYFLSGNHRFFELTGYSAEEARKMTLWEFHPESEHEMIAEIRKKNIREYDTLLATKDGKTIPVRARASRWKIGDDLMGLITFAPLAD